MMLELEASELEALKESPQQQRPVQQSAFQ